MRIFSRYMLIRFLFLLLVTLGGAVLIFLVIDFVENTTEWLKRPQKEIVEYYLNYIPHMMYLISPIAVLLASVFSVGNLARHLEIVAMKSAGVSPYRILSPLVFVGLLITLGMYYFNDHVLPDANYKRFKLKEPIAKENEESSPESKSKFVYISPDHYTYFFDYYAADTKRGQTVTLLQDLNGDLIQRYDAQTMYWDSVWIMENGVHREFKDSGVVATTFDKKEMTWLKDLPTDLVNTRVYPDEMTRNDLKYRIGILKRSGESTARYETQLHFKESGAWVNFIMLIIGISMAIGTSRKGITKQIGLSLLIAFAYFFLIRLGLTLGENGGLPPIRGAWLGNYVFGGLALILFLRVGRK